MKIYNIKNEIMFEGKNLSLKELVEKNKSNLKYAYLVIANLNKANLTGANLRYANLEEANLTRANLKRANLEGADIDKVKCSELTILPSGKTHKELLVKELLNKGNDE